MKSIKGDLEFFVKRNGELLKSQNESIYSFNDIFGDDFTNEEIELYMKNESPRYFETEDGIKFYPIHILGRNCICFFRVLSDL